MHRFTFPILLIAAAALVAAGQASASGAAWYEITVTNLTRSQVLTPPVAFTHAPSYRLFEPGGAASDGLAALAQDGVTEDLVDELEASRGVHGIAVASDGVLPGHSMKLRVKGSAYGSRLSILGMLASSNDAFFALQGERLPWRSSSADAPVYDAGSEANLESCEHIPGPPCGKPMVSPDVKPEGYIHIHNGIHGLADLAPEDLDWRGPAARITVRRVR